MKEKYRPKSKPQQKPKKKKKQKTNWNKKQTLQSTSTCTCNRPKRSNLFCPVIHWMEAWTRRHADPAKHKAARMRTPTQPRTGGDKQRTRSLEKLFLLVLAFRSLACLLACLLAPLIDRQTPSRLLWSFGKPSCSSFRSLLRPPATERFNGT